MRKDYWKIYASDIDEDIADSTPTHENYVNFVNIHGKHYTKFLQFCMYTKRSNEVDVRRLPDTFLEEPF